MSYGVFKLSAKREVSDCFGLGWDRRGTGVPLACGERSGRCEYGLEPVHLVTERRRSIYKQHITLTTVSAKLSSLQGKLTAGPILGTQQTNPIGWLVSERSRDWRA